MTQPYGVRSADLGLALLTWASLLLCIAAPASAQRIRPADERPSLEDFLPEEEPEPSLALPPIPLPEPEESEQLSTGIRVYVEEIRVIGSSVFSEAELAQLTARFTGRELSSEELIEARDAITQHYIAQGYITSGAVLPDQSVSDGIIEFQVIEGTLAEISIEGERYFRPRYLRERLELAARGPVNLRELEQRLQLLQADPRILRLHAQLSPGEVRGESFLAVEVEEDSPYKLSFHASNEEPPSIGSERGEVQAEHHNLTGNGDILRSYYGFTEGLDDVGVRYGLPLNEYDTTLALEFRTSESDVVESPFDDLDIESESTTYGIGLKHPVYRRPGQELWVGVLGELRRTKTSVLGEGFPFLGSGAEEDGRTKASVLRVFQEWTSRSRNYVVAARSTFSFGLDIFDASDFDPPPSSDVPEPDATFFSWLGQFQWAYRLPEHYRGTQLVFRTDLQLSADPLLSMEKIAVGGGSTVRGYVENELVRDSALISSLEFRIPIVRDELGGDILQLAPFADFGHAWNDDQNTGPKTIASLGVGLRWWLSERLFVSGYWGGRLRHVKSRTSDIQEHGFHLQATLAVF